MALQYADGRHFSRGSSSYFALQAVEGDRTPRIHIEVVIEGQRTTAMLDTGASYLLCSRELSELLDLGSSRLVERNVELRLGGYGALRGNLHEVSIELVAEVGYGIQRYVTAFVPSTESSSGSLRLPDAVVGFWQCMEKLRFAIDPSDDTFYFGDLGNTG